MKCMYRTWQRTGIMLTYYLLQFGVYEAVNLALVKLIWNLFLFLEEIYQEFDSAKSETEFDGSNFLKQS